jgi:hypothetical protein
VLLTYGASVLKKLSKSITDRYFSFEKKSNQKKTPVHETLPSNSGAFSSSMMLVCLKRKPIKQLRDAPYGKLSDSFDSHTISGGSDDCFSDWPFGGGADSQYGVVPAGVGSSVQERKHILSMTGQPILSRHGCCLLRPWPDCWRSSSPLSGPGAQGIIFFRRGRLRQIGWPRSAGPASWRATL